MTGPDDIMKTKSVTNYFSRRAKDFSVATATIAFLIMALPQTVEASGNLLRNRSFEDVPSSATLGQGVLPNDWKIVSVTPDTYSNDGSFGLPPNAFGNFVGITAQNGIRWVAGWSLAFETFGQLLSVPLVPGESYDLSGYLIQAARPDLDFPGGYDLYLTTDDTGNLFSGKHLGRIGPTTDLASWESFSLPFTAPVDANSLPFLYFVPYVQGSSGAAYPGLDNLTLSSRTHSAGIPDCGNTLGLFGLASGGIALMARKRTPRV